MMDYYEELGVGRAASTEEIRQAYKHLVRLLHPDHCSDPATRPLADLQMKRLNGILEVLTVPRQRRAYDRSLHAPPRLPPALAAFLRPLWFWVVVSGASLVFLACLLYSPSPALVVVTDHPEPVSNIEAKQAPPPLVARMSAVNPVRAGPQVQKKILQPQAASRSGSPPADLVDGPPVPQEGTNPAISLEQVLSSAAPAVPELEPPRPPPALGLAGVWLFVSSAHTKTNGALYPPVYIELSVNEESGFLRGRYRAQYHVTDRAISPVVSFHFEGRAGRDRVRLPWHGVGGAEGEVELRLLSSSSLEVSWVANQLSGELALISGTATLVRKLD